MTEYVQKREVPFPDMTDAMMDAGQRYLDDKSLRSSFNLPPTFNWHEFWRVLVEAAQMPQPADHQ